MLRCFFYFVNFIGIKRGFGLNVFQGGEGDFPS